MQNEDDLRGLAKVMEFMRALSILFVVINIYWFCYECILKWGINIGVVDRILINFQRTARLFSNILWTKLFGVVFLGLSCLGTKGVKNEKITWDKIYICLFLGFYPLFSELVDFKLTSSCLSKYSFIHNNISHRLYFAFCCRTMDEPFT